MSPQGTREWDMDETHAKLHTIGVHRIVYPDVNQLSQWKALYILHEMADRVRSSW